MSCVFITGGNGFLGHNFVPEFRRRFPEDTILAPSSSELNLMNENEVTALFRDAKIDTVIHLAAQMSGIGEISQKPLHYLETNLIMNYNVVKAAREAGVRKFIAIGSSCCYSSQTPVPMCEDAMWNHKPENTYGLSKMVLLEHLRSQQTMDWCFLIFGNLYGPWDHFDKEQAHLIPAITLKLNKISIGGAIHAWGDGTQIRDFLYVADASDILCDAYKNPAYSKRVLNVSNMEPVTVATVISLIQKHLDKRDVRICWEPDKPVGIHKKILNNQNFLQIRPDYVFTTFDAGLERTFNWYRVSGGIYGI